MNKHRLKEREKNDEEIDEKEEREMQEAEDDGGV
jgi:hypothetical protein